MQSGLVDKLQEDIYIEFILSFYPVTLNDFHKTGQARQRSDQLTWQPLNYMGFKQIIYLLLLMLILSIIVLFIEWSVFFLF